MEKKYRVKLSVEERQELKAMVTRGRAAAADPRPHPAVGPADPRPHPAVMRGKGTG